MPKPAPVDEPQAPKVPEAERPDADPAGQQQQVESDSIQHDVIVLGLGVMGLATCWQLARRGLRVLGLEQHAHLHRHGSSHGTSRVIRKAYFEHPDYVALLERAYAGWGELESDRGEGLINFCGALTIGPEDGVLIPGVELAAARHQLDCGPVEPIEAGERFPGFDFMKMPRTFRALYEADAGFIHAERARAAMLHEARRHRATMLDNMHVLRWEETGDGVSVVTNGGCHRASHLVITAGGWSRELLAQLDVPLTLVRKLSYWYRAARSEWIAPERFPCFIIEDEGGFFYGVPDNEAMSRNCLKLARHDEDAMLREIALLETPEQLSTEKWVVRQDEAERPAIEEFARRWLAPALLSDAQPAFALRETEVCMYSYSPDGHFILDRHPKSDRVSFAAGFSGHGFKFAPVIGEIMADLATGGQLAREAAFLGLSRLTK